MNKILVQTNNNYGVVSDENDNIKFIKKESDFYNFEEILKKENELEELKSRLENCKNQLSRNKKDMVSGNIWDIISIGVEFSLFSILFVKLSLTLLPLITIMLSSCIPFKVMIILMYGTRKGRHSEKNKLINDIEKMELELPILEKELVEIKAKSKYKVSVSDLDETKTSVEEIYPEMSLSIDNYAPEKHDMVKVLNLTKKK